MTTACDLPIDLSTKSQHHHHHHHGHGHHHHLHHSHDYHNHHHQCLGYHHHHQPQCYGYHHHHHLSAHVQQLEHERLQQLQLEYLSHQQLSVALASYSPLNRLYAVSQQQQQHLQLLQRPPPTSPPSPDEKAALKQQEESRQVQQQHQQPQQQVQQQAKSPPAHQLSQHLSLQQVSGTAEQDFDNPSPIDLHRSSTSSTVSTMSSPSSSSASITSTSSSLNSQQGDKKRINRPLTGKHVKHGTGASIQTLVTLRKRVDYEPSDQSKRTTDFRLVGQSANFILVVKVTGSAVNEKRSVPLLNKPRRISQQASRSNFVACCKLAAQVSTEEILATRMNFNFELDMASGFRTEQGLRLRKTLGVMFPPIYIDLYHRPPNAVCSLFKFESPNEQSSGFVEDFEAAKSSKQTAVASTRPSSRTLIVDLSEQLAASLAAHQAKPVGLCPIRRAIYNQLFDELIRQVTVSCIEQGLLLFRVRNELRMTLNCYRRVYESGIKFGLNKALSAELELEESREKSQKVNLLKEEASQSSLELAERKQSELRKKLESFERVKEHYENEMAKKDQIISQQSNIIKALTEKIVVRIESPV